ncbi:synembryn-A [Lampris incognitus]|uniref:synembryn-A n=1 Tax=Lampris incognitus TaxID=2546036 RepID=UPI0024B5CE53|nr:synembryn-A [Lampris incognitus]
MALNVERIIECIKQGDQDSVQVQLDSYNTKYADCFFFNVEERERRKQRELEEFRKNKVREFVPDSDSDFDSCSEDDDPDLLLRRRLATALLCFIQSHLQPGVLRVCLRTLRILSRDRQALGPLITDSSILTLAHLGGISSLPLHQHRGVEEEKKEREKEGNGCVGECHHQTHGSAVNSSLGTQHGNAGTLGVQHCYDSRSSGGNSVLARGKRDVREERSEEEEKEEDGDLCRKEAMKALCNVIYNSQRAQERAGKLSLLSGLIRRLKLGNESRVQCSGQFYELRLLFLLTALRPELRRQLQQEHGVSMLTTALEQCLAMQWADRYEALSDQWAPRVCREASQRAIEILKTLFNITYSFHRQEPDEEDAALYRHLAAILRHCLLLTCDEENLLEEIQGHTVNVLSALPLKCLDVLLSVRMDEGSREWEGVNMDCVHTLLLFMEKRLDRGQKLKEKLTPVLNLLTESCKAHRETRHYLRQQILPPLRDVTLRPEQGATLRGRLVCLMTHVDTDIKHCAAELLFVLCKENVSRFVKYTGYGNAAGLLAARGLLSGGHGVATHTQYSSDSDSDTEEYREAKGQINPVTGRVEEEQPDPMEGMSEEEKEQEARRLISMFNRLSRDKIIQPMGVTAEGRLAPLCGQMRGSTLEEEDEEEEEEEGESEDDMDQ